MDEFDVRIRNQVGGSFQATPIPRRGRFHHGSNRGRLWPFGTKGGSCLPTILVVDDEPNVRFLLRVTLEAAGYKVVEAHHGKVALERVKESPPDLVVTDLMMPVMGGRELIDRLKWGPETGSIPILVLSANGSLRAGDADAAMAKPFDPDELLEHVRVLAQPSGAE